MQSLLQNFFPFLRWFPMTREGMRRDLVAGITVALVLVPQSMAYAQLAGLPVQYGLYAAFVPVIVASLWGSSSQLHTGPVAMLSLMSAAALVPFAAPGSGEFIQLSIMLALMVGVLRLALGIFKLGAIVNLLSSPVVVGFTNAAALIIASRSPSGAKRTDAKPRAPCSTVVSRREPTSQTTTRSSSPAVATRWSSAMVSEARSLL